VQKNEKGKGAKIALKRAGKGDKAFKKLRGKGGRQVH
jgi:hypothetical protein